ncbi:MAG TPA: manganese catalase family protein, partial [Rubricoccaceae bacterium]
YHDPRLQYEVRVDTPNPLFAKMLQQAIGGIEGEIRVCLQYLFQAWAKPPSLVKYRDMLLHTGTEEISHIEMLCTAVALNLDGAPAELQDDGAKNPMVAAIMGGMDPRHFLSTGLAAMATDANGVPFNGSWVVGSGNLIADMTANVMAESTGRVLATRLFHMTDDPGMKDMLRFLIARDTMHQNQWLAVIEEQGGFEAGMPVPATFPATEQRKAPHVSEMNLADAFMGTGFDGNLPPAGRWTSGPSIDGKGEFSVIEQMQPLGAVPARSEPPPYTFNQAPSQPVQGLMAKAVETVKDALS